MTDAEFDSVVLSLVRSMHPDATTVAQLLDEIATLRMCDARLPGDKELPAALGNSIDRLSKSNHVWINDAGVKYQPQEPKASPQGRLF